MEIILAARLWLGKILYGRVEYVGVQVSPTRMIKLNCEEPEVEGHRYVSANTNIPVPRIYRVHQYNGRLAIEMEYFAKCHTLWYAWRRYTIEQKQTVIKQLASYMRQLRTLEPSYPERISSTNGGAYKDCRVDTMKRFGPFENSAGFHQCLRVGIRDDRMSEVLGEEVAKIHRRKYDIRFSHADLGVYNILVRDAKVVAIIDWEYSGWYPEYWEYTKAHYNSALVPEVYEMLAQHIDRYDEELAAERVLWHRCDQPLGTMS